MKVWILLEAWDYEGSEIIDVFSTKEAAEAEANSLSNDDRYASFRGPHYHVREFIVREGKVNV